MKPVYRIPAHRHRAEWFVSNSRFVSSVDYAPDIQRAKDFINSIRKEMPDGTHHVYAYRIGFGNTVVEGMSDDGEPAGTAGPPTLAVLRGNDIGDIVVVTTRYFGGTKLGKGGLVKAYTQSCQHALATLQTLLNVPVIRLHCQVPYRFYEICKKYIIKYEGNVVTEEFGSDIALIVELPANQEENFKQDAMNIAHGNIIIQKIS